MGGIAWGYDLLSSEYGWTDLDIDQMTFARFQQSISAIQIRKYHETRESNMRRSWEVRTLSKFISTGFGSTEMNEAADLLSLDPIEQKALELRSKAPKVIENTSGSYERLMGAFSRM